LACHHHPHLDASVSIYAVSNDLITMRIGVIGAERRMHRRRAREAAR